SNSTPEDDGLDDLLLAPEQALHDVSIGREQRRTRQGYLTPRDARAFLELARQPQSPGGTKPTNAIAAAHFRPLDEAVEPAASTPSLAESAGEPPRGDDASTEAIAESMQAVAELLVEAGVAPAQLRALLAPAGADASIVAPLQPLMAHVHDAN